MSICVYPKDGMHTSAWCVHIPNMVLYAYKLARSMYVWCNVKVKVHMCMPKREREAPHRALVTPRAQGPFPSQLSWPAREFPDTTPDWIVWDWGPRGTDITQATCWRNGPCRRLKDLERTLLQLPPLSMRPDQAARFHTRSARRALATAA